MPLTKLMEIDVGYAGINTLDMYTIVYRNKTAYSKTYCVGRRWEKNYGVFVTVMILCEWYSRMCYKVRKHDPFFVFLNNNI